MTTQPDSPSVRERQLARELREARVGAQLPGSETARVLGWSASKVSRIETGRIGISPTDLDRLLDPYQVTNEQARYLRRLAPPRGPAAGGTPTPTHCPPGIPGCCDWRLGLRPFRATAQSCRTPC
jgi:Helix-turn-helix domain